MLSHNRTDHILQSQWTTVNGLRMHARVSTRRVHSHASPIVLVHGLGVSSRYLVPLAKRLAPTFDTYVPDLPGFGRSEKPDHTFAVPELTDALAAWIEKAGISKAILLGNSLGCQIIVEFGMRYPERITHAVLVGPTADPSARTPLRLIRRTLRDIPHERLSLLLICVDDYLRAGVFRVFQTLRYLVQDPIEEKLPHLQVPTLILRGENDRIVPKDWVQAIVQLLPDGQIITIPGAAHAVHYASPAVVAAVTRDFVQRTATETSRPEETATREA